MNSYKILTAILLLLTSLLLECRGLLTDSEPPDSIVQPPIEANNIQVLEPVFSKIYYPGDTLIVKWIAPTIEKINIQLYKKSEYKFTLAENVNNNGNFSWIIPINIPSSNHYLIKIISNNNNNIFKYSEQFGIQ